MKDSYLYIKTGATKLDKALGGGWERGSGAFLYGKKGTAKTRICLSTAINALKKEQKVYWVDTEESLTTAQLKQILEANGITLPSIKTNPKQTDKQQVKTYELKLRKELKKIGLDLTKVHNFMKTWEKIANTTQKIAEGEKEYDLIVIDSVTAPYVGYLMHSKMEGIRNARGDWKKKQSAGRSALLQAVGDCQAYMVAVINRLHQLAGQEKYVVLMTGQPKSDISDALKKGVGKDTAELATTEGGKYTGGKAVEYPPKTVIRLQEADKENKIAVIESHRNVKPGTRAPFRTTEKGVE